MLILSVFGARVASAISVLDEVVNIYKSDADINLLELQVRDISTRYNRACSNISSAHSTVLFEAYSGLFRRSPEWAHSNAPDQLAWLQRTAQLLNECAQLLNQCTQCVTVTGAGSAAGAPDAAADAPAERMAERTAADAARARASSILAALSLPWILLLEAVCAMVTSLRPVPGHMPGEMTPRTERLAKEFRALSASSVDLFTATLVGILNASSQEQQRPPIAAQVAGAAGGLPRRLADQPRLQMHVSAHPADFGGRTVQMWLSTTMLYQLAGPDGYGWPNLTVHATQALSPAPPDGDARVWPRQLGFVIGWLGTRLKAAGSCLRETCQRAETLEAAEAALHTALASKEVRRLQVALLERLFVHGGGAGGGARGAVGGGSGSGGAAVGERDSGSSTTSGSGNLQQSWIVNWELAEGRVVLPGLGSESVPKDGTPANWSQTEQQRELESTHATWLAASLGVWGRMANGVTPGGCAPPPLALVLPLAGRAVEALWRLSSLHGSSRAGRGAGGGAASGGGGQGHRGLGLGGATYGPEPLFAAAYSEDVACGFCFKPWLDQLATGGTTTGGGSAAGGGGASPQYEALLPAAVEVAAKYLAYQEAALRHHMGRCLTSRQWVNLRKSQGESERDPGPDTVAAAAHNDSPQTSEAGSSAAAGLSVAAAAGSRPPGLGPGPGPGGGRAALSRHADTWEPLLSALSTVLYGIMSMRLNTSSGKGSLAYGVTTDCRAATAAAVRRSGLLLTLDRLLRGITAVQLFEAYAGGVGGSSDAASGASGGGGGSRRQLRSNPALTTVELSLLGLIANVTQVLVLEAPPAVPAAGGVAETAVAAWAGSAGAAVLASEVAGQPAQDGRQWDTTATSITAMEAHSEDPNVRGHTAAAGAMGGAGSSRTGGCSSRNIQARLELGALLTGVKRALAHVRGRLGCCSLRSTPAAGPAVKLPFLTGLLAHAARLGQPLQAALVRRGFAACSASQRRQAALAAEAHAYVLRAACEVGLRLLPITPEDKPDQCLVTSALEAWALAAAGAREAPGLGDAAGAPQMPDAHLFACQPHQLLAAACEALPRVPRMEIEGKETAFADMRFRLVGCVLRVLAAAGSHPQLAPHVLSWLAPAPPLQQQQPAAAEVTAAAAQPMTVAQQTAAPHAALRGCLREALREALPAMLAADDDPWPGQEDANRAHAAGIAALMELAGYWAAQTDAEAEMQPGAAAGAGGGAGGSSSCSSGGWARRASAAAWRQHFHTFAAELQQRVRLQVFEVTEKSVEVAAAGAELLLKLRLPVSGATIASTLGGYGSKGGTSGKKTAAVKQRRQQKQQQQQQQQAAGGAGARQEAAGGVVLPPPLPVDPVGTALWHLRVCGHPGCLEFGGEAEAALDLRLCGRCRSVRYCGAACQAAHWRAGHKDVCGQVAAAVVAVAGVSD